jgi:hypothetical protein
VAYAERDETDWLVEVVNTQAAVGSTVTPWPRLAADLFGNRGVIWSSGDGVHIMARVHEPWGDGWGSVAHLSNQAVTKAGSGPAVVTAPGVAIFVWEEAPLGVGSSLIQRRALLTEPALLEAPGDVVVELQEPGPNALLSWTAPADPDGILSHYQLWRRREDDPLELLLGTTEETTYLDEDIADLWGVANVYYTVEALDQYGRASEDNQEVLLILLPGLLPWGLAVLLAALGFLLARGASGKRAS